MAKRANEELKSKIKQLKEKKLLPYGYAKQAVELVLRTAAEEGREGVKCSVNNVNQVVAGNSVRLDIVEALIQLAEENKEKRLLERLDDLLKD